MVTRTRKRRVQSRRRGGGDKVIDCSAKKALTQSEVDSFFVKRKAAAKGTMKSKKSTINCMPTNRKNLVSQKNIDTFFKKKSKK